MGHLEDSRLDQTRLQALLREADRRYAVVNKLQTGTKTVSAGDAIGEILIQLSADDGYNADSSDDDDEDDSEEEDEELQCEFTPSNNSTPAPVTKSIYTTFPRQYILPCDLKFIGFCAQQV